MKNDQRRHNAAIEVLSGSQPTYFSVRGSLVKGLAKFEKLLANARQATEDNRKILHHSTSRQMKTDFGSHVCGVTNATSISI